MASAKAKMMKQLSFAYLGRKKTGTLGSTTLTAAMAAAAASATVAGITNFAVSEPVMVGQGEESEGLVVHGSTAPTGTTITWAANKVPLKNHVSGETVIEYEIFDLGDTMEDGAVVETSADTQDLSAGTRRLTLATLNQYAKHMATLRLPGLSAYNLCVAFGIPWANVVETGTTPTKWQQLITDGSEFQSETDQWLVVQSVLMDGTIYREELWGADVDPSNITLTFARGTGAPIACSFVAAGGGEATSNANPFPTPTTTYKAGKGNIVDYIEEVALLVQTGTPTSISSGGTINTSAFTLASGTGLAVSDWFGFQLASTSPETLEIHMLDTINTGTGVGTTKSKFYRSLVGYAYCAKMAKTTLGSVTADGVTFSMNGQSTPLRVLTSRLDTGVKPGNVQGQFSMRVSAFDLTTLATALGIAGSAITNNRLPITGTTVAAGGAVAPGILVTGRLVSGTQFHLIGAGCSNLVQGVQRALTLQGQSSYQLTFRPASCVEFFNIV